MSGPYTITSSVDTSVTLSNGTVVELSASKEFSTDDPCIAFDLLIHKDPKLGLTEDKEGDIANMKADAVAKGCVAPDGTVSLNPTVVQAAPPVPGKPPADGDNKERQGAPQVIAPIKVAKIADPGAKPGSNGEADPAKEQPKGLPDPDHSNPRPQSKIAGGDPVDLFTGRLALSQSDLTLTTATSPLTFVRSYQSGSTYYGPFGWAWDHNHNQYLREMNNGGVAVWNGDLSEHLFRPSGADFEPPMGVFRTLERLPGVVPIYEMGLSGGETRMFAHPIGWPLPDRIPLVEVRDRHGNRLRYSYDDEGRLAEVRDDDDRFFAFTYGHCGLFERLSDHAGRVVEYDHDPDIEHLVGVRVDGIGLVREFRYEALQMPHERRHDIVAMTDGDGDTFTLIEYDNDPASFFYGRVCSQSYGDFVYQFAYEQLQWTPTTSDFVNTPSFQVEMLDPSFGLSVSTFNSRGELLDHRFRLVRDTSYRVVASAFSYDDQGNVVGTVLPDGSEELRVYDSTSPDPRRRGLLLRRELRARPGFPSPSRIIWRGSYEPQFQLPRDETDESGKDLTYRYDHDTQPGGTGRLVAQEYPDGAVVRFEHDERGRITGVIQPSGVRNEIAYGATGDHRGLLVGTIRDAGGLGVSEGLRFDAKGSVIETIDAEGSTRRFEYDPLLRLVAEHSPEVAGVGATIRSIRNIDGRVVAIERPAGAAIGVTDPFIRDTFELDVLGNVRQVTLAANSVASQVMRLCHDHRGIAVNVYLPDGRAVTNLIDERGLVLRREETGSDGALRTQRYVYDMAGRLTTAHRGDAAELTTTYEYDAFGRIHREVAPNGTVTAHKWGPDDLLTERTVEGDRGDGVRRMLARTRYTYDVRGRKLTVAVASFSSDPNLATDLVTTLAYDADGNMISETDPSGLVTTYDYDALGRLVRSTDPDATRNEFAYDGVGRRTSTTVLSTEAGETVSRTWSESFDPRGRSIVQTDPLGNMSRVQYDDRDLPVLSTDQLGISVLRTFGAVGELVSEVADPAGLAETTSWAFDLGGRPVSMTDASGEVVTYSYDSLGRLRETAAGSTTVRRTFGTDGRVVEEERVGGGLLVHAYDTAGRLLVVTPIPGPGQSPSTPLTYRYDGLDRVIRAEQGANVIERDFDSLGRVIAERHNGIAFTLSFDDVTRSSIRTWPDGRKESITQGVLGSGARLAEIVQGSMGGPVPIAATVVSAGGTRVASIERLSLTSTYAYDSAARLTEFVQSTAAGAVDRSAFRFDAASRRRAQSSSSVPSTRRFEFDAFGRVTATIETAGSLSNVIPGTQAAHDADVSALGTLPAIMSEANVYAAGDERTSVTTAGAVVAATWGSGHRLATMGAEVVVHGPDGVRRSDDKHTYEVDPFGRVVSVRSGSVTTVSIEYDPLGRPWRVITPLESRELHHVAGDLWEERLSSMTDRIHSHVQGSASSIAWHTTGRTLLPVFDAMGSLVAVTDAPGNVLERYSYTTFGEATILTPAGAPRASSLIGVEPSFHRMRSIPGTQLYLAGARVFDARLGVFLSPDPMGFAGGPNPYAYGRFNPVDFSDPSGEFVFLAVLGIMAVGALVGGGLNAARQGIAIAEGSQEDFEWGQLAFNIGVGAVLAPIVVVAPEVGLVLAGAGIANGANEISKGHYATGTFDIVTSVWGARSSTKSPSFAKPIPVRVTNAKVTLARVDLNQREALLWAKRAGEEFTRGNSDTITNYNNDMTNIRLARAVLENPDLEVLSYDPVTRTVTKGPLGFDPKSDLGWDGLKIDAKFFRSDGTTGGDLDISALSFDIETKAGNRASDHTTKVSARNTHNPERSGLRYFLASEIPQLSLDKYAQYPSAVPGDVKSAGKHGYDGHIQITPGMRPPVQFPLFELLAPYPRSIIIPQVSSPAQNKK
jgi:RHS repeat-associated protein